jgi:hypothetical protein
MGAKKNEKGGKKERKMREETLTAQLPWRPRK